jgi:hypothetical protein
MTEVRLACVRCGNHVTTTAASSARCGVCDATNLVPVDQAPAEYPAIHTALMRPPPLAARQ